MPATLPTRPRTVSLRTRAGECVVIRYAPGREDEAVDEILTQARSGRIDWTEAAQLSFQVAKAAC